METRGKSDTTIPDRPKLKQIGSATGWRHISCGTRAREPIELLYEGFAMASITERISATGKRSFRVRTRLKGFQPQTASFGRKTDANKWASATESALREGRYFPTIESRRHTLADLIDRYERDVLPLKPKNAHNQWAQLEWWKSELGSLRLAEITPPKIAECRDRLLGVSSRTKKSRAPATVVRYLAVLSHAFTLAMKEWGWVDENPCRRVTKPKEPRGRVRYLSDDERTNLLSASLSSSCASLYPVVVMAIATGMRKGEIINLRWSQIDFEREIVTLHETKNGERRAVPLTGHALETLRLLSDGRARDALVFPNATGLKPIEIAKAWSTAVAKAELTDFRFHDLRHTAASYMAQGGATGLDIAAVLGHKTLSMVKRYAHLGESRVRQVVTEMNRRTFG